MSILFFSLTTNAYTFFMGYVIAKEEEEEFVQRGEIVGWDRGRIICKERRENKNKKMWKKYNNWNKIKIRV